MLFFFCIFCLFRVGKKTFPLNCVYHFHFHSQINNERKKRAILWRIFKLFFTRSIHTHIYIYVICHHNDNFPSPIMRENKRKDFTRICEWEKIYFHSFSQKRENIFFYRNKMNKCMFMEKSMLLNMYGKQPHDKIIKGFFFRSTRAYLIIKLRKQ